MAAPHAVTNHGNAMEEKLRRIGCLDGKQRMHRGFLNRVLRAELGMGEMKPIYKIKIAKKPIAIACNSSTAGFPAWSGKLLKEGGQTMGLMGRCAMFKLIASLSRPEQSFKMSYRRTFSRLR